MPRQGVGSFVAHHALRKATEGILEPPPPPFATTGSRSHPTPRNFGVSGETFYKIGRNAIAVQEEDPSASCWMGLGAIVPSSLMNLQDAVRGCVVRDAVRQVHIWGRSRYLTPYPPSSLC